MMMFQRKPYYKYWKSGWLLGVTSLTVHTIHIILEGIWPCKRKSATGKQAAQGKNQPDPVLMVIVRIKVSRSVCRLEYWGDRDRNCFFRSNPVILVEDSKHSATCPNSMPISTFLHKSVECYIEKCKHNMPILNFRHPKIICTYRLKLYRSKESDNQTS